MRERLYKRGEFWICRYRDRRGKIVRKSTKCRDYQAALLVADDYERAAADSHYQKALASNLAECVTDYYAELARRGSKPATMSKEATKAGQLMRLWKTDLPMARIDAALVNEYIAERERDGVKRLTIKMELGTLRGILLTARYLGKFHRPLEQVLPVRYSGKHKPKTRAPSLEELRALFEQLERPRAAHLAYFAATGARLSEAEKARRSHTDWNRMVVFLDGGKTELAASEVPITILTASLLKWCLENAPGRDLLFRPWGKLHRDVAAACKRAGIEKVTPNDLRRAFGTWHRNAGIVPSQIAVMLRHTTDKLAQTTYARLGGEHLGRLLSAQLGAPDNVSILEPNTAGTTMNETYPHAETPGKQAPPGRVELPTNALGKRWEFTVSREGTRGLPRLPAAGVPVLESADPADLCHWRGRGSAFHEAVGNLSMLLAGVSS